MRTIISVFLMLFCTIAIAQKTTVFGKIVEQSNNQAIEFATIIAIDKITKKPITASTSQESGNFSFNISAKNVYFEVTFMGFITKKIHQFNSQNNQINLGTIVLKEDLEQMDEIVVRAEKSETVFKLDKRVFNVGKDLSSTGASALEVLNNVPSVTVDIEGAISLRGGQGVQILINGKPSVLADQGSNALGTITADMIDKIEVITNPSAKYDAEGTSGILNIILKKKEKKGLNGSISINVGTPQNNSIGVSLNKRTEKFNLFSQLGIGRRSLPRDYESFRDNYETQKQIKTIGDTERNETFYNIVLGSDYHINKNNVITLSGSYAFEDEDENSQNKFEFLDNYVITDAVERIEETEASNPKLQYELQYKKDFKRNKKQNLLFSAIGSFFGKDKSSVFNNYTTFGTKPESQQEAETDFKEARYTYKLDYTHPFSKKYSLEIGSQYFINEVSNNYQVGNLENETLIIDPNLTNVFDFNQHVLGVYSTLAFEDEKWGIKTGLRLENTDLKTELETTNVKNSKNYTDLFPSLHTSYKLTEKISFQAGYSKRIFRPRLWSLNPFFTIRDNYNVYTGNPNLGPEYTDSYELTSIFKVNKTSLNVGFYHRYTTDVVERITTFDNDISTSSPINIGTDKITGVEFNTKYSPVKWNTFMVDFNWNSFKRNVGTNTYSLSNFDGSKWTSRITSKMKLPADFELEITGNYRSKYKTSQGESKETIFANLGLRKKIAKGKIIASLSVRDIFSSRINETIIDQPTNYLRNLRKSNRFISFGLSYGFGKGEAMEFKGRRRR